MKATDAISLSILLAAGCLLAPISVQAQSRSAGQTSGPPPGTESSPPAPGDSGGAPEKRSANESGWVVRIGVLGAFYHSGATIATSGQVIPGATAIVSNNLTVMFDIRRDITKNISLSLMAGVPPKPIISGKGTVTSLGFR